jgi:hypothetical protein
MTDQLTKLFESTKQLHKSEADEVINRLSLIRNSSLLDERIKDSIAPILKRVTKISANIEDIKIEYKDFKKIQDLKREIRIEEQILELLENAISTFISHRNLSTTLSILFEHLYYEITQSKLPFLVVSREGEALQTYPSLKSEKKGLLVGVIGIPLFSISHTYEWILAGHEFGHIMANKILNANIEYVNIGKDDTLDVLKRKVMQNYEMEILADYTAMQIFGPAFLEVLLTELTGAEYSKEIASSTHPPIPWRIRFCYEAASYYNRTNFNKEFEQEGAKEFVEAVASVIDERYPKEEAEKYRGLGGVKYDDMVKSRIHEMDFEKIRNIKDLKNCYRNAYKFSKLLLNGGAIPEVEIYSPDQVVIGGYLASRWKPQEFKTFSQKVTDFLMKCKT